MAASKNGLELVKALTKRMTGAGGFDRTLEKVKIISGGGGKCTAELQVQPEHQNAGGTLHGGFTATLVDVISTLALMTHEKGVPGVTVDLHVIYLKAAREGEDILINANTLRAGRTLAYLDVELRNKANNDLIARGTHTKFIG